MTPELTGFTRDGLEFDVTTSGPVDGEPSVLLHGFPQRSSCWRLVEPLLHDGGLRTYALDQRGYSPGARPRGRWNYRISALVDDAIALAEEVGRPVHLVGHDWGAVVAWGVAATRPDLVSTLTAISVPHPGAMARATVTSSQALRSWYFGLFNVPFLVDGLVKVRPHALDQGLRASGMASGQLQRFHSEVVEDGALATALAWYRAVPLSLVARKPAWSRRVTVPTTYVWSTDDSAISRAAAEGCDAWVTDDYRYVELEHVSHWIPEEAPALLADVVLDRVGSQR
ncbi:alpha/beta fold hydrolase [Nocardioides daphniae]|uniref:Alpha/beta fold hydrolase n=1 Tax=Nocardioides daphniae TaxID=402297 RepID=A0A4P7UCY6_9ACTN|nr:alpha/beta fold hydrolase [Nocardioides daphniae]QCC78102.1 alpha/beta fold hydrolase [Nocardioides daphniae]GGD21992.1 alpha/beta hydrolase [Nocardioides daphniae]